MIDRHASESTGAATAERQQQEDWALTTVIEKRDIVPGSATAAIIALAVIAGVVPALQPLLLGGLLKAGRLSATELGYAATVESLGMAVASTLATFLLKPHRLRLVTTLALVAAVAASGLTIVARDSGIVAARGLSGMANGVLLWMLVGLFTRAAQPARTFAFYVTAQAIAAFLLSSVFATLVLPRLGVTGAYGTLLLLNVSLLLLVPLVPARYADLPAGAGASKLPNVTGTVGLIAVAAQLAGVMAFWVYALPLAQQAGLSGETAERTIGVANSAQILAGLAACATAARFRSVPVLLATAGASIIAVVLTYVSGAQWAWTTALLVFAFCWMFAPPFHIAFLLRADPTGRAAMLISPAQLMGMAIGPMLAAKFLADGRFDGASLIAIACFGVAIMAVIVVALSSRTVAAPIVPAAEIA